MEYLDGLTPKHRIAGGTLQVGVLLLIFFQAEDGIRALTVTGVQPCALPISVHRRLRPLEVRVGLVDPVLPERTEGVYDERVLEDVHAVRRAAGNLHHLAAADDDLLPVDRSEEHTSELQSQSNLVCRLLLEKK